MHIDSWQSFHNFRNLKTCRTHCLRIAGCNAFAWNENDVGCYLKYKPTACTDKSSCLWKFKEGNENDWRWYWRKCSGIPRLFILCFTAAGIN